MPAHQRVRTWIAQNYQKPVIDQEWLADCSDWLSSELGLDPVRDFDQFIQNVEAQLLQSNLTDSTVPGSGVDPLLVTSDLGQARPRLSNAQRASRQASRQKRTTGATPLLVEIRSITEIAHSAFSLLNTHQTRLDRADLGLAQEEDAEQLRDEDEGPVPRFPRGMLRFELSDGFTTFRAIEFRSLPQLELGTTPLGYKMVLKSTPIRNGIAFLEPSNVTLKGYRTEDHDINKEQVFLSSLRKRLGRPEPPLEALVGGQPEVILPEPPPGQPARQPIAQPPSPPIVMGSMYADEDVDPDVLREMAIQFDEAFDTQENQQLGVRDPPLARPPSTFKEEPVSSSNFEQILHIDTSAGSSSLKASSTSPVKTSPYFAACSFQFQAIPDIGLSPRHAIPPNLEPHFDISCNMDDPESFKLPPKTGSTSARPPPTAPAKHVPPEKRPSSPDPFDDLSFDMDVDESFLEQVGMIEQGALVTDVNSKGKGKDIRTGNRPGFVLARKMPSGSAPGTKRLALCPVSLFGAELSTRIHSTKRATSASPLSSSTGSPIPQSTQSSGHHLSRGPSPIIISSEDEAPGCCDSAKPLHLAWRRSNKREVNQDETAGSDVIDISD